MDTFQEDFNSAILQACEIHGVDYLKDIQGSLPLLSQQLLLFFTDFYFLEINSCVSEARGSQTFWGRQYPLFLINESKYPLLIRTVVLKLFHVGDPQIDTY